MLFWTFSKYQLFNQDQNTLDKNFVIKSFENCKKDDYILLNLYLIFIFFCSATWDFLIQNPNTFLKFFDQSKILNNKYQKTNFND